MVRKGHVYFGDTLAGVIEESNDGVYYFAYTKDYLAKKPPPRPVSITLPLQNEPFQSRVLFSFFDGLIPEGWLLDLASRNWKIDPRDRMGLLLEACRDCIGAVHIEKIEEA